MPKYFTPPDKITQNQISPFNYLTPNNTQPLQKKIVDPNEKCVIENCFNRRMILVTGEQLLVCSPECEKKLRGFYTPIY